MFFMILLGIIVGIALRFFIKNNAIVLLVGVLLIPLLMGLGYEFIRFAGKHPSWFTRLLSAPGLWMQRITTKEPTDDMLECAITSLKCSLRDDYPEFRQFYEARGWEPKTEEQTESATTDEQAESENDA
jgi:uncharacterized protein YqhQ